MMSLSVALLLMASMVQARAENPSLVKVKTPKGSGTGSVVRVLKNKPVADGYEGYVLTAYHVVNESAQSGARDIQIVFPNGRVAKDCKVVASDIKHDISLIWAWIPQDVAAIEVSPRAAAYSDELIFHGLGGGIDVTDSEKVRHIPGTASAPTKNTNIYSDVVLIPGDSGGPVTLNGKLVGVISGGWFWYKEETGEVDEVTQEKKKQKVTWPGSACGLEPIKELFESLNVGQPTPNDKQK
jgi:S1-C subfamily serine protease